MFTSLRAFLLLRHQNGDWQGSVFHTLDEIVRAWDQAGDDVCAGVLHVGFERRNARSFDDIAQRHSNRLLLTPGAKGSLPRNFRSSTVPVGEVDGEPIFLALEGWGYSAEDPLPDHSEELSNGPVEKLQFDGWVKSFATTNPEQVSHLVHEAIADDASYFENEKGLPDDLRRNLAKYRFETLGGNRGDDPTQIARFSPPWLLSRSFDDLDLTVRLSNVFTREGIQKVDDLRQYTIEDLMRFPNFGRTSRRDLSGILLAALDRGPTASREALSRAISHDQNSEEGFSYSGASLLEEVEISISKLEPRTSDILKRRMGWGRKPETLEEIARDYGITRERVRQIEAKTIKNLIRKELWDDLLAAKLEHLLSDREYPLPLIGVEALDPWFSGISERRTSMRYLVSNLCDAGVSLLKIEEIEYLAFLDEQAWINALRDAREILKRAADRNWERSDCEYQVGILLPETSKELRSILWEISAKWCHFAEIDGQERIVSYGRGVEQIVEAVLHECDHPLHYSEICRIASQRIGEDLDERRVHNAAAEVGFLYGSGTYGLLQHMSLPREDWEMLADEAAEIVAEDVSDRQWHSWEIIKELEARGVTFPASFDKYQLDIALKKRGDLKSLGRMVWTNPDADALGTRLDIREAMISIVKAAGKPISTAELRQRLVAIRGINETTPFHVIDPLIKLDAQTWGLNDRDLELKRGDQPAFLDRLVEILGQESEPLHVSVLGQRTGHIVPDRALLSLAALDDRLSKTTNQFVSLRAWDQNSES